MRLVYPTSAAVLITNTSPRVVQQPKYQIVLWNLDSPEPRDPLPVPVSMGDYIRPQMNWGPNQLVTIPAVKSQIKRGDHLFGYGMAFCPDCAGVHFYWLYIENEIGGWFSELPPGQIINTAELFKQMPSIAASRDRSLYELAPITSRISIRDWP